MAFPTDLAAFKGIWRLDRRINDLRAGQIVTGQGQAQFRPEREDRWIYDEELSLSLPNAAPITGRRRYLWQAAGDCVTVLFDDARPFHAITLGGDTSDDTHFCTPDTYVGRYDFGKWPIWTATWTVSGPKKSYQMVTTYRRAATL